MNTSDKRQRRVAYRNKTVDGHVKFSDGTVYERMTAGNYRRRSNRSNQKHIIRRAAVRVGVPVRVARRLTPASKLALCRVAVGMGSPGELRADQVNITAEWMNMRSRALASAQVAVV